MSTDSDMAERFPTADIIYALSKEELKRRACRGYFLGLIALSIPTISYWIFQEDPFYIKLIIVLMVMLLLILPMRKEFKKVAQFHEANPIIFFGDRMRVPHGLDVTFLDLKEIRKVTLTLNGENIYKIKIKPRSGSALHLRGYKNMNQLANEIKNRAEEDLIQQTFLG